MSFTKIVAWVLDIDSPYFYFYFITLMKHSDYRQLEEERVLFHLIFQDHSPSLREVRARTQDRNLKTCVLAISPHIASNKGTHSEPGGYLRSHGRGCLLFCFLTYSGLASFILKPRTTRKGMMPPRVVWVFLHQLIINTISQTHP